MLVFFVRQPRPDARYWAGREFLAALDAVGWPIAWIVAIRAVEVPVGVMGPFFIAVCVLAAVTRLRRALWENHRYWFTTWKWGRYVFAIWIAGMALKLAVGA